MTVTSVTVDLYHSIDCTDLTRITIDFIRATIESQRPEELRYLTMHDEIRSRMRDIVEMPGRIADLFVRLCRQNHGTLSERKRELPGFSPLTDKKNFTLETVVRE